MVMKKIIMQSLKMNFFRVVGLEVITLLLLQFHYPLNKNELAPEVDLGANPTQEKIFNV